MLYRRWWLGNIDFSCREVCYALEKLKVLFNVHLRLALRQDADGHMIFHIALEHSRSLEDVNFRCEYVPGLIRVVDIHCGTRMHAPCIWSGNAPLEFSECLVK